MRPWMRHWQLKVVALLLSILLWVIFHFGRPSPKPPSKKPVAAAKKAR